MAAEVRVLHDESKGACAHVVSKLERVGGIWHNRSVFVGILVLLEAIAIQVGVACRRSAEMEQCVPGHAVFGCGRKGAGTPRIEFRKD